MIRSLPFTFVSNLKLKKDTPLPREYLKSLRADALRAETNHIRSIQLWRHALVTSDTNPQHYQKLIIYRAEVEDGAVTKTRSVKTIFLDEVQATFPLKMEPWIIDTANHLSMVRNYRKILFGDGAKLKLDTNISSNNVNATKGMELSSLRNFWFDTDNHSKLCVEGAVANLLFHMNMIDDAAQFKMLSVMSDLMIRVAMDVDKIPKNVLTNRDGMDPIEKTMWILEKKFNCQ